MDYIHKLPFLLGGFMAVIVGIASYIAGSATQTIYIRMAVIMVAFYFAGTYIRNTVKTIKEEIRKKEEQKALEAAEEEARLLEEQQAMLNGPQTDEHKVDLVADDFDDEFSPMTISRVISAKLKE